MKPMDRPNPTPRGMADEYVDAVKFARLQHEKIGVHFAGMKKSVADLLAYPADHLAEDICQPAERPKILVLRKQLGLLLDQVEAHQSSISSLCQLLEMAAGNVQEQQGYIDALEGRIKKLEADRNGRD